MLSPEAALQAVLEHEQPGILMPLQSWAKLLIEFSPAKKSKLFYIQFIMCIPSRKEVDLEKFSTI